MIRTTTLAALLLAPGIALGWQYVQYQGNVVVYDGPVPPADLTYPDFDQPTPMRMAGEFQEGEFLSAAEFQARMAAPHLVIVPPLETIGGRQAPPPRPPEQRSGYQRP